MYPCAPKPLGMTLICTKFNEEILKSSKEHFLNSYQEIKEH